MRLPFKVFIISGVLLTVSIVASAQPRPHHPVHHRHRVHHVHHVAHRRPHHPLPPHR